MPLCCNCPHSTTKLCYSTLVGPKTTKLHYCYYFIGEEEGAGRGCPFASKQQSCITLMSCWSQTILYLMFSKQQNCITLMSCWNQTILYLLFSKQQNCINLMSCWNQTILYLLFSKQQNCIRLLPIASNQLSSIILTLLRSHCTREHKHYMCSYVSTSLE